MTKKKSNNKKKGGKPKPAPETLATHKSVQKAVIGIHTSPTNGTQSYIHDLPYSNSNSGRHCCNPVCPLQLRAAPSEPPKLKKCSCCKIAEYCGRLCQESHYTAHKPLCKLWTASDSSVTSLFDSGTDLLQAGDDNMAKRVFQRVLELAPEHDMALVNMGCMIVRNEPAYMRIAQQYFERALDISPSLMALTNLAQVLIHQGLHSVVKDENLVERCFLSIGGSMDYFAHYLKGLMDVHDEHFDAALVAFDAAAALNGDDADVQFERGKLLEKRGERESAIAAYAFSATNNNASLAGLARLGAGEKDVQPSTLFLLAQHLLVNSVEEEVQTEDNNGNSGTELWFVPREQCERCLKLLKKARQSMDDKDAEFNDVRELEEALKSRLGTSAAVTKMDWVGTMTAKAISSNVEAVAARCFIEALENCEEREVQEKFLGWIVHNYCGLMSQKGKTKMVEKHAACAEVCERAANMVLGKGVEEIDFRMSAHLHLEMCKQKGAEFRLRSVNHLTRITEVDENHGEANFHLGLYAGEAGQSCQALYFMDKALKNGVKRAEKYVGWAREEVRAKEAATAEAEVTAKK